MESVSSHLSARSTHCGHDLDEESDDLFDFEPKAVGQAATVSMATAGTAGVARVRMSAFSILKEFHGRDSDEEKARAWLNRVKSAARRDEITGEEVCSLFGDLMSGSARQWYLQLGRGVKKSWTDLTEQFRVQYCGKGVSMASKYFHTTRNPEESPLDYLYRLNVAAIWAKIHYEDGTKEEKREHVEMFINTLGSQGEELASHLTLMEVSDAETLENKLRAHQRALTQQKKTHFGSGRFRQTTATPTPPARAVHAVQTVAGDPDPERDEKNTNHNEMCDHDCDDGERAGLLVLGRTPQAEAGDMGRDRARCRHCRSLRHASDYCRSLLTCKKCGGRHPTERCMRVCKACGEVHEAGDCPLKEFFNQIRQWYDPKKHSGMLSPVAEKLLKLDRSPSWKLARDERSVSVFAFVAKGPSAVVQSDEASRLDNVRNSNLNRDSAKRTPRVLSARFRTDEYARESPAEVVNLDSGERRGYWKYYARDKWHRQAKIHGKLNNRRAILLLDSGAEVSILDTTFAREVGCQIDTSVAQDRVGIRNETYQTIGRTRVKVTLAGNLVYFLDLWVGDLSGQQAILGMNFMIPSGVRIDSADGTACLPDEERISLIGRKQLYGAKHRPVYPKVRIAIGVGRSANIRLRLEQWEAPQLWVTRGPTWVTTVAKENAGRRLSFQVTNIGDKPISLDSHVTVGWWTPVECVPRAFGFVRASSRRYQEWQNLAFEATSDEREELSPELPEGPLVDRPTYNMPTRILHREDGEPSQPDHGPPEGMPRVNVTFTAAKAVDERRPVASTPTRPTPQTREQERWKHADNAFETLKAKVAETPMLKDYDPDREPVVIVYASDQAISAVVVQRHEDIYLPVKFTSRMLKPNELNYSEVEKEILALLQILDNCFTMLVGRTIKVLTRHTTLVWLSTKGLQGRLFQWAAVLSPWSLEVNRSVGGEEEILRALAASVTTRAYADMALKDIAPRRRPSRIATIRVPIITADESMHVVTFNGSAKLQRKGGAFSAIIWKLPGWEVVRAKSAYAPDRTVNEAEYQGMLLGFSLLETLETFRIIICGDSNLVIGQMRGEMKCKSHSLKVQRQRASRELKDWPMPDFFHVRRDWNASADMLGDQALQHQGGAEAHNPEEIRDLMILNRLDEVVRPILHDQEPPVYDPKRKTGSPGREMETPTGETDVIALVQAVVTRTAARREEPSTPGTSESRTGTPDVLQENVVLRITLDSKVGMTNLEKFLNGEMNAHAKRDTKNCSKLADRYEVAEGDLLYNRPKKTDTNIASQDADAKRWRLHIQRHYTVARAQALEPIRAPVEAHAERQNEVATDHPIEGGTQVWLYLHRVKPGYARKFLWHGPFRVAEIDTYAARLETDGTTYQLYPLVHISKLKAVRVFPTRPETRLTVPVDGRFDFDEELLPEDSWEPGDLGEDVFEVEKIVNMREGRAIRYGRTRREFEVKWRGYPDTTWVDELDLNCGGLLYDFLRERTSRNRFQVMQSHENGEVAGTRPDD